MSSNGEPTLFEVQDSIPIIDYSLLTSGSTTDHLKAVQDIGKACEDWGCFMLVNHGVPETLIQEVMDASDKFFNMTNEEKLKFQTHGVLDPIRSSRGCNAVKQYKDRLWREFLRLIVYPDFNCPGKPQGLSEAVSDYVKRVRVVATELIKGVSESLGFEESYVNDELNLDAAFHLLVINNYPPVSDLDIDISPGVMPHTDHSLITLINENGVPGLEVLHNGKWVVMGGVPNAFFILISDQFEIFSNGKYTSKLHRSVVKDELTRVSLAITSGSSLDTTVGPSSRLVDGEDRLPRYLPMKYSEYIEFQVKHIATGNHGIQEIQIRS